MLETLCEYLIHVSVLLPHISKHKTGDMVNFSDNFLKPFIFVQVLNVIQFYITSF